MSLIVLYLMRSNKLLCALSDCNTELSRYDEAVELVRADQYIARMALKRHLAGSVSALVMVPVL